MFTFTYSFFLSKDHHSNRNFSYLETPGTIGFLLGKCMHICKNRDVCLKTLVKQHFCIHKKELELSPFQRKRARIDSFHKFFLSTTQLFFNNMKIFSSLWFLNLFNPLTLKISLVILLTVCDSYYVSLEILVSDQLVIPLLILFFILITRLRDTVRRNSVLVIHGS